VELTPRQNDAVRAERSVAVTAGAGTGKTAMLAERFLHHVLVDQMSPLEVAAVTFTEKAAAELRSRIRETLLVNAGEDRAAEADAAQISTIHSLAARICRDFYDRVGIPADFRMLDETDADIILAAWFDDALGQIEPDVVTGLGYSWLSRALKDLCKDPPAALEALSFDDASLREYVERACEDAVDELIESDCWGRAAALLERFTGDQKDPVEGRRQKAVSAMADILARRDIDDALKVLKGLATSHGTLQRWPDGGLDEIRGCLLELRDAFKKCADARALQFGDADSEMCRRALLLRKAFAEAFEYLQKAKKEQRLLDFADLEFYALEILKADDVRAHYAKRWKAILVDEFQDTNPVQEKILHALVDGGARLTIVGDGKQSIYGFRRADPRVFQRFRKSIGNDVVLDRTFRTHAELVRPMNHIFSSLLGHEHESLVAERSTLPHDGPFVECHSFADEESNIGHLRSVEGSYIASEIARMLSDGLTIWDRNIKEHRHVRPGDIAILSRTRAPLEVYVERLLDAHIPAVNVGGGNLLNTQVAKDMSVLLRFAADTADDIALVALLRGPFFAVSDKTLYDLSKKRVGDETWWQLITNEHRGIEREFPTLSEICSRSRTVSAEQLIEIADQLTGYTAVIANLEQSERRMADRAGFISLIRKFAALGRSDVIGTVRYLNDLRDAKTVIPRPPLDPGDAVSLMTIHASKGLEWPIVFVPNLSAGKRSDSSTVAFDAEIGAAFKVVVRRTDGSYQREEPSILTLIRKKKRADENRESARILYVAMTRAQDRLYLTAAGKEGNDLEKLMPGLEHADIKIQRHGSDEIRSLPLEAHIPNPSEITQQISSLAPHITSVPASGLIEYATCPKRFKYRFIDGHPGIGQGSTTDAARIGTLTHLALELKLRNVEDLKPFSDGAPDELLIEAMRLTENFYSADDFLEFRTGLPESEVSKTLNVGGLQVVCKIDRVGDDYVLDFKTNSEMSPEHHAIQLWSYAKVMNKKRAVLAYLRQQKKYEYTLDELDHARTLAEAAINGIAAANFVSTPTETGCRRCSYCVICEERHSN
jgi:ATP-dependent helicase/nuclease subunit A